MFNKILSESGRSMVEVLCVLVIIGIVCLGGIKGYKFAIRNIRSNAIAQDIAAIDTQYQTDPKVEPTIPKHSLKINYSFVKNTTGGDPHEGRIIAYKLMGEEMNEDMCLQLVRTVSDQYDFRPQKNDNTIDCTKGKLCLISRGRCVAGQFLHHTHCVNLNENDESALNSNCGS